MALAKKAVVEKPVEDVAEDVVGEVEEVAADVAEQTAEVVKEVSENTVVATTTATKIVPAAPKGGEMVTAGQAVSSIDRLAEMGFRGLKIDYYSHTNLKIKNGSFSTDEDELDEKEFTCTILEARPKYSYATEEGEGGEQVFSYDRETVPGGGSLADLINDWVIDGEIENAKDVIVKEYCDAVLQVYDGTLEDEIVVASVSPSSVGKLGGYQSALEYRGFDTREKMLSVVTKVSVGKTVSKGSKSWNPWKFSFVKTL